MLTNTSRLGIPQFLYVFLFLGGFFPLISGCASCDDPLPGDGGIQVTQLYPELQVSVTELDFDSYRVGIENSREITIGNDGKADLKIGSVGIQDDDLGAFVVELDKSVIAAGGTATMTVTFAPLKEGVSAAILSFGSNDEDEETTNITLAGIATLPNIFVSPKSLEFTEIQAGDVSTSQVVEISNQGTGFLQIQDITLDVEGAGYFQMALPSSFEPGFLLDEGLTLPVRVSYRPPEDGLESSHLGQIQILSDSPNESVIDVTLSGTSSEAPVDLPPEIIIYEPDPKGTAFVGQPVLFDVEVYGDEGEDVSRLLISWFSSIDGPIGTSTVIPFDEEDKSEGGFIFITSGLTVGEHVVSVFATDSVGNTSMFQVEVEIWNEDTPLNYVITGSTSIFSYFNVDDNLQIFRIPVDADGAEGSPIPCVIWVDDLSRDTTHPPVSCNAAIGDKIRVIAYDRYAAGASVSGLTLRFGDESQVLTPAFQTVTGVGGEVCPDSPQKDVWYDEHDTPNTDDCIFLDVTVEVTIPTIPEPSN